MTEGKRSLIQGLLQEYDIETAQDIQDALKDLLSGTVQRMLEAEMDNHLGYGKYERSEEPNYRNGTKSKCVRSKYGEFEVEVPQDRQSSFESQIIPKRKKDIFAIDDKIISMYAKGMTTRQISETIEDIYGFEVMDSISAWICLIPFLLIIPFTACISYYRLASAHINSFLRKFGQKDM